MGSRGAFIGAVLSALPNILIVRYSVRGEGYAAENQSTNTRRCAPAGSVRSDAIASLPAVPSYSSKSATGRADPRRRPLVAHHRGLPARPAPAHAKPDATDLAAIRAFMRRPRRAPTAIDVFCGAGGLSLGLERAGFDVLVGADSDEWAVRTHHANMKGSLGAGTWPTPPSLFTH